MLKPTLNNLTILCSILTLEFIVINCCMFQSTNLSLINFFNLNAKKHGKNNS